MAFSKLTEASSPYYPPRARWYGPLCYVGHGFLWRLGLDQRQLPNDVTLAALLGGFLVPGLAVYFREPRLFGKAAILASAVLLGVFTIFLGHEAATLAFGMMFSLHISGFVYYCNPFFKGSLRFRLFFTVGTVIALGCLVYLPASNIIEDNWVMPLQLNNRVVVVQRNFPVLAIHRGDYIAYKLGNDSETGAGEYWVVVHSGMGLGPVLATPGDKVEFFTDTYSINGVARPLLPHMPQKGKIVVSENHWFIWPDLDINTRYRDGESLEENISKTMLSLATVSQDDFMGKPFRQWFWHEQILL
jgi:hypothetical protein